MPFVRIRLNKNALPSTTAPYLTSFVPEKLQNAFSTAQTMKPVRSVGFTVNSTELLVPAVVVTVTPPDARDGTVT